MRRHYRFWHDRSHRDGDVLIAHYADPRLWDCFCGQENFERSHCCQCSQERGNWQCEDCGHVNKQASDDCETCGREKPDE